MNDTPKELRAMSEELDHISRGGLDAARLRVAAETLRNCAAQLERLRATVANALELLERAQFATYEIVKGSKHVSNCANITNAIDKFLQDIRNDTGGSNERI